MLTMPDTADIPRARSMGLGLTAQEWLAILSITGYPMVAGLSAEIGLADSPALSILVRVLTAVLGIYCLWQARRFQPTSTSQSWVMCAYLSFWTLYLLRVVHAAYLTGSILPWSGTEYLSYALIFSILPSLGGTRHLPNRTHRMLWIMSGAFVLALLTNLHQFFKEVNDLSFLTGGRAKSDKLNPISLGIMACNALLILYCLWQDGEIRNLWRRGLALLLGTLAFGGLVLSGSKGPTLALLVSLLIFHLFPLSTARTVRVLGTTVVVGVVVGLAAFQLNNVVEINLITRFMDLVTGQNNDQSNQERLWAYTAAWAQIVEAPILGSALVDNVMHYYPHNLLLEVLLSTGVVGMLFLLLVLSFALYHGIRLLEARGPQRWIPLMLVQSLVGAMASGGIHMASQLWFLVIAGGFAVTTHETPSEKSTLAPSRN